MLKRFILSTISIMILLITGSKAFSTDVLTGTMLIAEFSEGKKKSSEEVVFFINDNLSRIDASSKVHYLINLDDEITYVINNKRQTVTKTYASNVLEVTLPPLIILKSRASLKNYLSSINAHLEEVVMEGLKKYEIWKFNIGCNYYRVKVILPEYFPEEVEITSKKQKTVVKMLNKSRKPLNELPSNFFIVPDNFKVVDLIAK